MSLKSRDVVEWRHLVTRHHRGLHPGRRTARRDLHERTLQSTRRAQSGRHRSGLLHPLCRGGGPFLRGENDVVVPSRRPSVTTIVSVVDARSVWGRSPNALDGAKRGSPTAPVRPSESSTAPHRLGRGFFASFGVART